MSCPPNKFLQFSDEKHMIDNTVNQFRFYVLFSATLQKEIIVFMFPHFWELLQLDPCLKRGI